MTSDMPWEERSGKGLSCMTSDMKDQRSEPNGQQYSVGGEITLGVRTLFSQFCPLLGTRGFQRWDCLYLTYHSCSAHVCLTAYYKTTVYIFISNSGILFLRNHV